MTASLSPEEPDFDGQEALEAFGSPSDSDATERPRFIGYPFTLGVASGSPVPTGVVLWTRLAPDPLHGGGVGADPVRRALGGGRGRGLRADRAARQRRGRARPRAHSVHVEVTGLQPGRWYFYRFIAGDELSPVGRTRTAPAAAELPAAVAVRVGLVPALRARLLRRAPASGRRGPRADGVRRRLHLRGRRTRLTERDAMPAARRGRSCSTAIVTRNTRRIRICSACTRPCPGWSHGTTTRSTTTTPARAPSRSNRASARRRAAAYQAYFEHMPLRERARPTPARMVLRSRHDWGRLARFHLLDGRQRRTPQACPRPGRGGANRIDERCRELFAPGRTMLGAAQESWVAEGLAAARERWNFIAQQTLMARAGVTVGGRRRFSSDRWDGYPAARDRLLAAIDDNGLRSCVVLSGDEHARSYRTSSATSTTSRRRRSPRSSAVPRSRARGARRAQPT